MCKKKWLTVALIAICVAAVAAGTMAYFTAEETAYNVITTGKLEMILHDETTGGKPFPSPEEGGISGVMPDMNVDKVVYIENSGNVDMYVRIRLENTITAAEGIAAELNFDHIELDINTSDWTEKDGYYYYNQTLKPGEKTEPLFTMVQFGPELSNDYMDARVEIDVDAQAVQSKNNADSPLTAAGWPKA